MFSSHYFVVVKKTSGVKPQ